MLSLSDEFRFFFLIGESRFTPVDSWTTGEELASLVVRDRGINECNGWSVSLVDEEEDGEVREMNGFDYVLDLISEMEVAPAFPVCKNFFLVSGKKGRRPKVSDLFSLGTKSINGDGLRWKELLLRYCE